MTSVCCFPVTARSFAAKGRKVIKLTKSNDVAKLQKALGQFSGDPRLTTFQDDDGNTAMMIAASLGIGHRECLSVICKIVKSVFKELAAAMVYNLVNNLGLTALMIAAERGFAVAVKTCAWWGTDPLIADPCGQTCMHLAVLSGRHECVVRLVETCLGTQPAQCNLLNIPNKYGVTALHLAAARRYVPTVRLLITAGSSIMSATSGLSCMCESGSIALHIAARNGASAMAWCILREMVPGFPLHGADQRMCRNAAGDTPFDCAMMGNSAVPALFLDPLTPWNVILEISHLCLLDEAVPAPCHKLAALLHGMQRMIQVNIMWGQSLIDQPVALLLISGDAAADAQAAIIAQATADRVALLIDKLPTMVELLNSVLGLINFLAFITGPDQAFEPMQESRSDAPARVSVFNFLLTFSDFAVQRSEAGTAPRLLTVMQAADGLVAERNRFQAAIAVGPTTAALMDCNINVVGTFLAEILLQANLAAELTMLLPQNAQDAEAEAEAAAMETAKQAGAAASAAEAESVSFGLLGLSFKTSSVRSSSSSISDSSSSSTAEMVHDALMHPHLQHEQELDLDQDLDLDQHLDLDLDLDLDQQQQQLQQQLSQHPLPAKLKNMNLGKGKGHWSSVMQESMNRINISSTARWNCTENQATFRADMPSPPSTQVSSLTSSTACTVCQDAPVGVTIVACQHSLCFGCALFLHIEGQVPLCPQCRSKNCDFALYAPQLPVPAEGVPLEDALAVEQA